MLLSDDHHSLLREVAPLVLSALMRRYRDFAACEDAVQEALVAASLQWPSEGVPEKPRGWLIQVASRRITDQLRAEAARRAREEYVVSLVPADEQVALALDAEDDPRANQRDDTLELLFRCCHPALTSASAVALTLRAVGGLTTLEIAKAYLVPEATMAQRISRAKATIKSDGAGFEMPSPDQFAARLSTVLEVLYLIFNEGYAVSGGPVLVRVDLSSEAIRLTRLLHRLVPEETEVTGLLALMVLTDARRAARTGANGELIPLDEQDRSRWHRALIDEGVALISSALPKGTLGPYQLQAAIAAVHDEAPSTAETDWPQIVALYEVLEGHSDSPMVPLNAAIAAAMVHGPMVGLERLERVASDPRLAGHYRVDAVRAHLLERSGDKAAARASYQSAADKTASVAERNYLLMRAAKLR